LTSSWTVIQLTTISTVLPSNTMLCKCFYDNLINTSLTIL
jgi:hypothetical protein